MTAVDGVVLAADARVTSGGAVIGEAAAKIEPVHPTAAVGSTDDSGAVQSFVRALRSAADRYGMGRGEPMNMTALSTRAGDELPPGVSVLLGGVDAEGPHLFVLDPPGGVLADAYAALGSGGDVATGILDRGYDDALAVERARSLAVGALEGAAERDGRTGARVLVAAITADGVALD